MKIVKIEIKEFGKLRNRCFDLSDSLTLIQGDNEAGKSTLLLFIKFMLYGIAKKTRGVNVSEAERALSRESESASGSMTVSHLGKLYRIDRKLHKTARAFVDKLQVTDCETGLPCDVKNSPGEFFLGIPCEIFESSCSVSQLSNTNIKGENIGYAIQNLISSADETVDVQKTVKLLEAARVKYLHKDAKGGTVYELRTQKELLEERYTRAVEDSCETDRISAEIAKLDAKISEVSQRQRKADELFSKINLRAVIKLFDKLHMYEKELEANRQKLSSLTDNITKNGITPDRNFLARLTTAKNEQDISQNEYNKVEERQKALEAKKEERREDEKKLRCVASLGGRAALREKLSALAKKAKSTLTLTLVFAALATVAAAGALLTGLTTIFTSLPLFGALLASSVLFFALSGVMIALHAKAKKELLQKCALLETSFNELELFFAEIEKAEREMAALDESISKCKAEAGIKKELLEASFARLCEILSPYAKADRADKDGTAELLERTVKEISEYCDEKENTLGMISSLEARIRDLGTELTDYNEHQVRRKVSDEILSMSEGEIQAAKKEKSYFDLQLRALGDKKLSYERAALERKYSTQNPFDVAAKLAAVSGELEAQERTYDALALAIDTVNTAGANMRKTLTPKLRTLANEYLSRMSGGKYDSLGISEKLELSMSEDGFAYSADAFSTGTKDLAYITLRLALLSALPSDELPPIFMDETLAMIDDTRTANILSMLADHCEMGGQCVLFTCHDREANICKAHNIPHECQII